MFFKKGMDSYLIYGALVLCVTWLDWLILMGFRSLWSMIWIIIFNLDFITHDEFSLIVCYDMNKFIVFATRFEQVLRGDVAIMFLL